MRIRVCYIWIEFLLRGASISKNPILLKPLVVIEEYTPTLTLIFSLC